MESVDINISVWVCREEKLVFGLSKRTTCADVVRVLLEDQRAQRGLSTAPSYCIVEKWRGCERILPNKTRILRLWNAWGDEQRNVKFVLVKTDASLANHGARSAEARVVLSKQSPYVTKGTSTSHVPPEKQRRIVRKAFRKLEMSKKRATAAHMDASCAERMETVVHFVLSQDHTVRQQTQRISELDSEIEMCEAKVHFDRIKRHGINYVQNIYLVDIASSQEEKRQASPDTFSELEEYVRRREEVIRLQEEVWQQESLIDSLTVQIQEELDHLWMERRKQLEPSDEAPPSSTEERMSPENEEEERVKTQLDVCLYISLRLSADLEAIMSDLELTQQIYGAREREMMDLLEKVNTLDIDKGTGEMVSSLESQSGWVEQARGLSKAQCVNDDDSDTGLSSLHSQDSDSLPLWESLV
ncbi:ras association domain-containing protein 10 [Pholidichthys leucotaenia]